MRRSVWVAMSVKSNNITVVSNARSCHVEGPEREQVWALTQELQVVWRRKGQDPAEAFPLPSIHLFPGVARIMWGLNQGCIRSAKESVETIGEQSSVSASSWTANNRTPLISLFRSVLGGDNSGQEGTPAPRDEAIVDAPDFIRGGKSGRGDGGGR